MPLDKRNLLEVLKAELSFLERGGYTQQRSAWRPPFIFEDSPICPNFHRSGARNPCYECILMKLVPVELRSQEVPCRHIPLDDMGNTIESLYKTGTQQELEWALDKWLRKEIKRLEEESAAHPETGASPQH